MRGSGGRARRCARSGGVAALREAAQTLADGATRRADRRRAQGRARRRPRHRDAGATLGPADLSGGGRHQPAHRFQLLGPRQPRPAVRARRDRASASRSASRRTPTRRRCEAARLAVQSGLDDVHARAYALVGARDPGAELRSAPDPGEARHERRSLTLGLSRLAGDRLRAARRCCSPGADGAARRTDRAARRTLRRRRRAAPRPAARLAARRERRRGAGAAAAGRTADAGAASRRSDDRAP